MNNKKTRLRIGHAGTGRGPHGQKEASLACGRVLPHHRDDLDVCVSPAVAAGARPGGVQGMPLHNICVLFCVVLFEKTVSFVGMVVYLAVAAAQRQRALKGTFLLWSVRGSAAVEFGGGVRENLSVVASCWAWMDTRARWSGQRLLGAPRRVPPSCLFVCMPGRSPDVLSSCSLRVRRAKNAALLFERWPSKALLGSARKRGQSCRRCSSATPWLRRSWSGIHRRLLPWRIPLHLLSQASCVAAV